MEIRDAVTHLLNGEAILFLGSGFSYGALNINDEPFAIADELKNRLLHKLSISDENYDLPTVANHFIKVKGEQDLIEFLKKEFTAKKVTTYQKTIASQKWQRIYTTNYDNIIESVTANTPNHFIPVTPMDDAISNASTENLVVHLNGYIDRMDANSLNKFTKLTNVSYAHDTLSESKWRTLLSLDFSNAKAIFFVGFSLNYDLDISRLIYSDDSFKSKTFFVNGKTIDSIRKSNLEEFGHWTDLDANEFAELLLAMNKTHIHREANTNNYLLSFNKIEAKTHLLDVNSKNISLLFFKGELNQKLMQDNNNIPGKYSVLRLEKLNVIKAVNDKNIDLIVIHSHFGNGKTTFIDNLKYTLINDNKLVFEYNGNKTNIMKDIQKINNFEHKEIVLIIEDYYKIKNEIKYLLKLRRHGVTVIVSGRSSIHFQTTNILFNEAKYYSDRTMTFDIDKIYPEEINQLYDIIDSAGLWGENSSYNTKMKKSFLQKNSKRGFSNVMFEILKSNNMLEKLATIFNEIQEQKIREIVIASFITNILRSDIELRDILMLLDTTNLSDKQKSEPNLNEFLNLHSNKIKLNSGVASKHILSSQVKSDELVNVMKILYHKADKLNVNKKYNYLCVELVSFSNFNVLFSNREHSEKINYSLDYFESLINSNFAKNNHFFWLQYAIQKLEQPDYLTAEIYFNNAYSLAKKNHYFNTYQIDTHFARYHLEVASNSIEMKVSKAFEHFKKAHSLLINSNSGYDANYSIRQAIHYKDFYAKFNSELTVSEKIFFYSSCNEILEMINKYKNFCSNEGKKIERYVITSERIIKKILPDKH